MLVKKSEFSRMACVSRMAITKAVKSGKLIEKNGKIDTKEKSSIEYLEKIKKNKEKIIESTPKTKKYNENKPINTELVTEIGQEDIIKNGNLMPPWKKGQSGNPKGCPKGRRWETVFRSFLLENNPEKLRAYGIPVQGNEETRTLQERIVLKMINMALMGNEKIISIILDRMDGKAINFNVLQDLNNGDNDGQSEEISKRAAELASKITKK